MKTKKLKGALYQYLLIAFAIFTALAFTVTDAGAANNNDGINEEPLILTPVQTQEEEEVQNEKTDAEEVTEDAVHDDEDTPLELTPPSKKDIEDSDNLNDDEEIILSEPEKKPAKKKKKKPAKKAVKKAEKSKVDPKKPMIAITFDDGPYPKLDKDILAALKKYNARATFFVVGNSVNKYGDGAKAIVDAGCEIANHSYSHKYLPNLSPDGIKKEIEKTNKIVKEKTGVSPTLTRVPYGAFNDKVKKAVNQPIILWNIDTQDWKYRDSNRVYNQIVNNLKDGNIILIHDIHPTTAKGFIKALPVVVKKGYQVVTVSEMFKAKNKELKKGQVYFSAR